MDEQAYLVLSSIGMRMIRLQIGSSIGLWNWARYGCRRAFWKQMAIIRRSDSTASSMTTATMQSGQNIEEDSVATTSAVMRLNGLKCSNFLSKSSASDEAFGNTWRKGLQDIQIPTNYTQSNEGKYPTCDSANSIWKVRWVNRTYQNMPEMSYLGSMGILSNMVAANGDWRAAISSYDHVFPKVRKVSYSKLKCSLLVYLYIYIYI